MPVKYWSSAGLLLTDWCNARCASCYLRCGPDRSEEMPVEMAISLWRGLIAASPHGCRIHLSGGEPFGDWPRLIEICRRAKRDGLAPLQKVETNAFWAVDEEIIRDRLAALDGAGMERIAISADPYHQQYVPIDHCRRLADIAIQMLGQQRVQVRWRDWLDEGFDTGELSDADRNKLFAKYADQGRDRCNGRAAEIIAKNLQCTSWREFADSNCSEPLLRSRHVHVDGAGRITPGVCAGLVLGVVTDGDQIGSQWQKLDSDHASRPIVGLLAQCGPVGLMDLARQSGFAPAAGYASKCHLCWSIRRHLSAGGLGGGELAPAEFYGAED